MAIRIQIRRGESAEWTVINPILAEGELALESDTTLYKVGDGVTAWNSLPYGGISGGPGLQGIQGVGGGQGIQGIGGGQGVQGLVGGQGIQGLTGDQGIQGIGGGQGVQGIQGVEGSQGLQGFQGDGIQGVQGLEGGQGVQGIIGGQGIQGLTGDQGVQGLIGNDGLQGLAGLQGIQGTSSSSSLSSIYLNYTTGALVPGDTEDFTLPVGSSALLLSLTSSTPSWTRVYGTSTARDQDTRLDPGGTLPLAGSEFYAELVTTTSSQTIRLSPVPVVQGTTGNAFIRLKNTGQTTSAILVSLKILPLEV